jgi:UDP-N-acetylenolpyruvoylglucosamine reductase
MQVPFYVLGGGSNTIFQQSDFTGLIIKNDILGIARRIQRMVAWRLIIGAGEKWDDARCSECYTGLL